MSKCKRLRKRKGWIRSNRIPNSQGRLYQPGPPSRRHQNAEARQLVRAPDLPLRTLPRPTPHKPRLHPTQVALAIVLIGLAIVCSTLSIGYYTRAIRQPLAHFVHPVSRSANEPPPKTTPTYDIIKGRSWNMLLLGSDNDGKNPFPRLLTQVMMVVHIDTVNNTVHMVSIPRDSWVNIPEIGEMHKIDQAFFVGASRKNQFDDGVRLARLTIEKDYGITIDRYGWVGLNGFANVIDTLGGIDIDVTHPMVDDAYPDDTGKQQADPHNPYTYKRLYIAPGPQHLNGEEALAYVRTRHSDLVGDIGRTQRQQQVLQALKQKLNIFSIVEHLDALLKDLNGQIYTDLSEDEMLAFANFARTLAPNTIQRLTLGLGTGKQNFGSYSWAYDSLTNTQQSIIIPNCATIQPVINTIFALGNTHSCNINGP